MFQKAKNVNWISELIDFPPKYKKVEYTALAKVLKKNRVQVGHPGKFKFKNISRRAILKIFVNGQVSSLRLLRLRD